MSGEEIPTKPTSEIARQIADQFEPFGTLQNADLYRKILRALDVERAAARYYATQIGRWVARGKESRNSTSDG